MPDPYTIYFAGDLFDHKHLLGNAFLADFIERQSEGRYACRVPQNFEFIRTRTVDVRNIDLMEVMACDMGLFNFDGTDLDSGTVVEFMFAKMLDIPSVILRTDFRRAGDGDDSNWNLMATNYPRTNNVNIRASSWYREAQKETDSLTALTDQLYTRIANTIIVALDDVRQQPPLPKLNPVTPETIYQWAIQFPASGLAERCGEGFVDQVLARKRAKGLL
ncbi:MAG: nucleoside 2-deoxyribosyltransferase [Chloroflexota bacterium]